MDTEVSLREELRRVAHLCLTRLMERVCDDLEPKDLLALTKEVHAMETLVKELEPLDEVRDFHLTLTVEDGKK